MKPLAKKARVRGFVVEITLVDGSIIERDFTFMFGPAFKRWRRADGIDPRVRLNDGVELSWPGGIDFGVDTLLWGGPPRRTRPMRRACVMPGGLIAAPWVKKI